MATQEEAFELGQQQEESKASPDFIYQEQDPYEALI